jgi:hypothetical protein
MKREIGAVRAWPLVRAPESEDNKVVSRSPLPRMIRQQKYCVNQPKCLERQQARLYRRGYPQFVSICFILD